jgi:hypothetical protein
MHGVGRGKGDYDEAEGVIQQLLLEAGDDHVGQDRAPLDARGAEVAADWEHLASGERRAYTLPARLERNEWALAGEWTVERGFAALNAANGRIAYRFHARDLHLVMGPATPGTSVRFRVFLDGQTPGAAVASVDPAGGKYR